MAFKDVKQNYSVYILNKQDITITDGKVISVGFPHLDLNTKPAMGQSHEKILESVPKQKEVVDKTTVLLSELNPVYKEKKETEQRFSKIEESISRMESTVNNFINSFNHAQGNSNTAQ